MYIKIGMREIELDIDAKYHVYGEDIDAQAVTEMDFEHLNWLDQRIVSQSINLNQEISILFHPEVVSSLETEIENSPYWEKNRFEALAVFRRLQQKTPDAKEDKQKRKMLKEVDLKESKYVQKRFRVVNMLVSRGYERPDAMEYLTAVIEQKGSGVMNLKPAEICDFVDIFTGAVQDPNETQYHTRDDTRPCTLYYLQFTHQQTGETFKKIGITVRPLAERFVLDVKTFDLDIIHTVELPANEAKDIEAAIKKEFKPYKYTPETKLRKGGDTECFNDELIDASVMKMMGRNKVSL